MKNSKKSISKKSLVSAMVYHGAVVGWEIIVLEEDQETLKLSLVEDEQYGNHIFSTDKEAKAFCKGFMYRKEFAND